MSFGHGEELEKILTLVVLDDAPQNSQWGVFDLQLWLAADVTQPCRDVVSVSAPSHWQRKAPESVDGAVKPRAAGILLCTRQGSFFVHDG